MHMRDGTVMVAGTPPSARLRDAPPFAHGAGVVALPDAWRARASDLRTWGAAEQAATALDRAADELESQLRAEGDAELNLEQAASECGYSPRHLARLVRDGTVANAGRKNAPRIRRADLPRKPGTLPPGQPAATFVGDRGRIARAVVHSERGD
jgi:hypothetical protein